MRRTPSADPEDQIDPQPPQAAADHDHGPLGGQPPGCAVLRSATACRRRASTSAPLRAPRSSTCAGPVTYTMLASAAPADDAALPALPPAISLALRLTPRWLDRMVGQEHVILVYGGLDPAQPGVGVLGPKRCSRTAVSERLRYMRRAHRTCVRVLFSGHLRYRGPHEFRFRGCRGRVVQVRHRLFAGMSSHRGITSQLKSSWALDSHVSTA